MMCPGNGGPAGGGGGYHRSGRRTFEPKLYECCGQGEYPCQLCVIIQDLRRDFNAFEIADDVLRQAVQSISDLIRDTGFINLDFADVTAVMKDAGLAHMGVGRAAGKGKAEEAARMAISSPLLETSINGAKGVLINVTGSMDIGLEEVEQAATLVQQAVHPDALTIFGATFDEELDDEIRVTVIATGFESNDQQEAPAAPAAADTQQPTQDDAAAPAAAPQPLDEAEGEKAEESDVDRSFDEILKIFSRGDKF